MKVLNSSLSTEAPLNQTELLPKVSLLETLVSTAPYSEFLQNIISLAQKKISSYVCFANVHMLMESRQDQAFKQVVNQANMVTPDGRPLSVLMRLQYGIRQDRVCGMDLLPDLLREAETQELSVYFYGSTPEVLEAIRQRIAQEYPNLRIAGLESPPFRQLTPEEDQEAVARINASGAHLVLVSLGCPKQEKWMAAHRGQVESCMLGLGQAFLTYTGMEKRLPAWARNLSLEWAYRFYLEPRRLWKRYLVGNSWFLYSAIKSVLFKSKYKTSEQYIVK
ncbi:MAG: WecB/TagA/CpsF family glycosyltransferase [Cyclobacteriaceae bacterium]